MALTHEENDRLTRVANGAPMGEMLKKHCWIPAALSEKLIADGAPLRVRLLGENYVAFRATDGRVGLFDEACPHRGASLALARNEDNALRCIYHGWKFSVEGVTVEVPTQASNAAEFCKRVPLRHYRTREAGGIVWVWLGTGEPAPKFPNFEFTGLPKDHFVVHKQTGRFNWVQAVETTMDSAHAGVLHQSHVSSMGALAHAAQNQAPVYAIEERPYGFRYAGIRALDNGEQYVRVNSFVLPWYGVIAPRQLPYEGGATFFAVPIDDENSTYWTVRYRVDQPIEKDAVTSFTDPADWPPAVPGNADNNWGQDRELMRRGHFTGFPQHLTTEDLVIVTSQGPIVDRTREFLNSGDGALVRLRRLLLQAVGEFAEGRTPALAQHDQIDYARIRAGAGVIPAKSDWRTVIP
jgi:phenylpropionate dioxygenase-like ring-hydroxylating dioxygenase large terminal subunit